MTDTLCVYYYSGSNLQFEIAGPRTALTCTTFAVRRIKCWTVLLRERRDIQANLSQNLLPPMKHFPGFYVFICEESIS